MRYSSLLLGGAPRITLLGQGSTRVHRALALACALVLVAHAAWLARGLYQSAQAIGTDNAKILAVQAATERLRRSPAVSATSDRRGGAGMPASASTMSATTRDALHSVVQRLNVPWQDIFEQLEQSTPPEVALLGIAPDGPRRQLRLQAEAASLDALLRYASSLQHQGVFGRLNYSKHETNAQDPNQPVRLSFEVELLPPARLQEAALAASDEGATR